MTKLDDKVNEILGIKSDDKPALESIIKTDKSTLPQIKDNNKSDIDNDYDYSRENYYNLIEKGQQAIEGILEIAKEGQAPRSYEVLGALISNVATTIEKLQDLQKKMKDLKDLPKTASPQIKNALFVGSTKDLQQLLRQKDQKEDKVE
jgi:hypothetical protein